MCEYKATSTRGLLQVAARNDIQILESKLQMWAQKRSKDNESLLTEREVQH